MAVEQFNRQQLILPRSAATGIESYYKELSKALSSLAKMMSLAEEKVFPVSIAFLQLPIPAHVPGIKRKDAA